MLVMSNLWLHQFTTASMEPQTAIIQWSLYTPDARCIKFWRLSFPTPRKFATTGGITHGGICEEGGNDQEFYESQPGYPCVYGTPKVMNYERHTLCTLTNAPSLQHTANRRKMCVSYRHIHPKCSKPRRQRKLPTKWNDLKSLKIIHYEELHPTNDPKPGAKEEFRTKRRRF